PLCVVRVRPITTPARPLFPYTTLFRSSEPLSENHQQLGCVRRCAGMPPIRPFDGMDDINEPPGMGSRRVVAGAYRRRGPPRPPDTPAPIPSNPFKLPCQAVLSDAIGGKPPTADGDIDAGPPAVQRAYGQADVEGGVRVAEAGQLHGAGQHYHLVLDIRQRCCGHCHGVGTMGDQDVVGGAGRDSGADQLAVIVVQLQTVLPCQGFDGIIEPDPRVLQQLADDGLADLEFAQCVEVHLVDGAAGTEDLYEHDCLLNDCHQYAARK